MINEVLDRLGHPFAEAAWAKAPALAAVAYRSFMGAARTESQDEAILQDSTFEIVAQLFGDMLWDGPTFRLAIGYKGLNICRERLVEQRFFGLATSVDVLFC